MFVCGTPLFCLQVTCVVLATVTDLWMFCVFSHGCRGGLFVAVTSALGYRESRLYVKWEFVEASLFRISYAANCD